VSREVDQILSERSRRTPRRAEMAAVAVALAVHLLFVAVAVALPRLTPPPAPMEFVPVQIIPAQALGVRRPAPPRKPRETATVPEPAAEKPAVKPEVPKPKPQDDVPVLPSPDSRKKPKPQAATPAPVPSRGPSESSQEKPAGTAPGETGDQLGRRGGALGNPLGTTAFGSELGGIDNPDFTYGYYLDRLLSLIDAQWARPSMGTGIKTVLFFRIHRDGRMTELRVEQSSGYNSFDLAALRAVQNAAPFSPLPRAFQHDSLGVTLIVR